MTRRLAASGGGLAVVAAAAYLTVGGVLADNQRAAPVPPPAAATNRSVDSATGSPHPISAQAQQRSLTGAVNATVSYLKAFAQPVDYRHALALMREITLAPSPHAPIEV